MNFCIRHNYRILLLAFTCWWLGALSVIAAGSFCDNLQGDYEVYSDTYNGRNVRVLDFSEFLERQNLLVATPLNRILSLKRIFQDFTKEIFLNINADGHVSVTALGQRFDGRLAYIKPITLAKSRSTIESGIMVRLRPDSPEFAKDLLNAMQEASGKRSLTCVSGTCTMGRKAGLNLPKAINPKSLMEHFLKQGLQWRGQKVEFDVITTNKVGDLSAHLKSLQRAPQSLTWRVFQAAAFKGKVWTMGAMLFLQKSVVRPIAGLVFYPIPKDSPPPEPTEQN